ncbi:MAG TPA: zf-HC2 domain-containing protein, partial [Candidatus Dormibacteraeota bacterium]|nr:zf-HC2 domain-containing protein [Candidatus Dormibacteraeota bacterium]
MSDHEELESSVAAWVLGALDASEAETMRAHVEGCATCREVADRLRRVVGALPLAADEVAPPARLRSRILAAASATR